MPDSSYISSSKAEEPGLGKAGSAKSALCAAAFLALSILSAIGLGLLYEGVAAKNKVNAWSKQRFEDFYNLEDELDMIFIGSSHSYCTFAPEIISGLMGISSFQLGMPLQHPDSTYFTLLEALSFQSPSAVVMEVYWDVLDEDFEVKQADALFQVIRNDSLKERYIREVFPWNEKIKYNIAAIRFQQDFLAYANSKVKTAAERALEISNNVEAQAGEERYAYRGFMYCDYQMLESEYGPTNQFAGFDGKNWTFSKVQKQYLSRIAELCEDRGIELFFVTAPVAPVSMDFISNYDAVHDAVSAFAKSKGIPYLDFNIANAMESLFDNSNFRDDAHLNYSGAEIACEYFSRWMEARPSAST
ncbi:MAG: hypothetical protein LBU32_22045 [Clostridiales bacterium]|jgi:hypothetical protein|nr:hypothetical protein [Clostridiales bacterium]